MPSNPRITLRKKPYNSSTDAGNGIVVFDNTTNRIYVGGGCYSSDVRNATLNSTSGILTITKYDNSVLTVDLNSYERTANKVTSLTAASTNDQYPSAKCVYELSKDKPEIVWQAPNATSGILATETDLSATPAYQPGYDEVSKSKIIC